MVRVHSPPPFHPFERLNSPITFRSFAYQHIARWGLIAGMRIFSGTPAGPLPLGANIVTLIEKVQFCHTRRSIYSMLLSTTETPHDGNKQSAGSPGRAR